MRDIVLSPADSSGAFDGLEAALRQDLTGGRAGQLACSHLDTGGARTRACLALTLVDATNASPADALAAACSAELLHNASLVHDDIQDNAALRRGRPTLVAGHGAHAALCVGDALISAAWSALSRLPDRCLGPAMRCMHTAITRTCDGQIDDLDAAASHAPAYLDIVRAKSGPLLALPVQLVALTIGRADRLAAIERAALAIAEGYQILDDLADVTDDRVNGRLNIVSLLIDAGFTPPAAERHARKRADTALAAAGRHTAPLPGGLDTSLAALAARMRARAAPTVAA